MHQVADLAVRDSELLGMLASGRSHWKVCISKIVCMSCSSCPSPLLRMSTLLSLETDPVGEAGCGCTGSRGAARAGQGGARGEGQVQSLCACHNALPVRVSLAFLVSASSAASVEHDSIGNCSASPVRARLP